MATGHFSGHVSKSVTVLTNAVGTGATVMLKVEGDVWQAVDVKPQSASFGRLTIDTAKDPTLAQTLTIVNNMETNAELTEIRSTNPLFQAKVVPLEAGKKFELKVAFASAPSPGSVAGTIEMATGIKEMPTLSVPVNAYITPDVEVMPPNLALPQDLPTASNRQLFIQNNSKTPIKVSDLQSSNPDLKLALEEMQAGMKYKINVDVPPGYKAPPGGDKITFKTDNSSTPEVLVVVTQLKMGPTSPRAAGPPGAMTPAATKALLSSHQEPESTGPDESVRVTDPSAVRPRPERMGTERTAPKQVAPAPPAPARPTTTMPSGK
jgi:hypothetical protein